jgi:tetratricopeptide (TPR) repeat protein
MSNPPIFDPGSVIRQAVALHQAGKVAEAAELYRRVLPQLGDDPQLLYLLGTAQLQLGNYQESAELLGKSLQRTPGNPGALSNRGIALHKLGRLDAALRDFELAAKNAPNYAEAFNNCGGLLNELGRYDAALTKLDRALALVTNYVEAHNNRGNALKGLKRFDEALTAYERALALNPHFAEAHNNRGDALRALKRFDEALAEYDRAIALKPDFAEAYNNRGHALKELKRLEESLADCDRAIALQPDDAHAYSNRSSVLRHLWRLDEAMASSQKALELNPDYAEAFVNQGCVFFVRRQLAQAQACFDRAIARDPGNAEVYWNKALAALQAGDFAAGWELYEARQQNAQLKGEARNFPQAQWSGNEDLTDKTLLIHAEQGYGDTLQFCRYAPRAAEKAAHVVIEAPSALLPLLATLNGEYSFVAFGDPLPAFDYHCPIMSLPRAFHTTLDTIPADVPYLFADPARQQVWRTTLGEKTVPRIGLAWSGQTAHPNDAKRSLQLAQLAPLLELPFAFHCLQKEIRPADAARLKDFSQLRIHADALHDFADTAALVAEMDLVIAVDTSLAHLAGALGKPLWLMLSWAGEWRWLQDRTDSPWYPTATLFRQPVLDDWSDVLATMMARLQAQQIP